jgi:hypothetical protein
MVDPEPNLEQAATFLGLLGGDGEYTFQVFDDSDLKRGYLAKVCHGALEEEAARLAVWNQSGAGVFVVVNEADGMGRRAENITRVRAVFVDLDGAPLQPVLACMLEPHIIVESSPGRFHAYWIVDGLPLDQFPAVQRAIAARFNGDPAVIDVCRVMRVPGFYHQKAERFQTRVHGISDRLPYTADQILAEFPPVAVKGNGAAADVRDEFGWLDLDLAVLAAAEPGRWHSVVRDAVASMVSRGVQDDVIQLACRAFTQPGYTDAQTAADVRVLIEGARAKGWGEDSSFGRTSAEPAWPGPLGEAAYHGLAGDVVRAIEPHSEADPVALLLQFLAGFGNAAGRGHYVQVEGDRHPPQVWPVLVGETAKARKGTSWGRVRHLLELASPIWATGCLASGLSSGEGLIWQVRDPLTRRTKDKDSGEYREEEIDSGVADKRLLVTEAEFASPLRMFERGGNTLSSTLRALWDTGDCRALTKNSPARTTGSMVTVIGHITIEELRRYMTRTELGNGLANRFLFVLARRSKALPFGGGPVDLQQLGERVADRLGRIEARGEQLVMWTDSARRLWAERYEQLSAGQPGMAGAVISRAEAQTLRLALLYALLDGVVYLEPEHLRAAFAAWHYCEQSAAHLFGASLGNPLADEIRRALAVAPDGMTRTNIRDLFGRNKDAAAIGVALEVLAQRGLARCETRATGARPEERWFAQ